MATFSPAQWGSFVCEVWGWMDVLRARWCWPTFCGCFNRAAHLPSTGPAVTIAHFIFPQQETSLSFTRVEIFNKQVYPRRGLQIEVRLKGSETPIINSRNHNKNQSTSGVFVFTGSCCRCLEKDKWSLFSTCNLKEAPPSFYTCISSPVQLFFCSCSVLWMDFSQDMDKVLFLAAFIV